MKNSYPVIVCLLTLAFACSRISKNSTTPFTNEKESDSLNNQRSLQITYSHSTPVITVKSKGAEGILFGFEGGRAVKVNGTYHLFTSELFQTPKWVKMRLGYWTSQDKVNWKRVSTIRESSAEFTGKDPRAALWSPLPVFDEENNVWNLFYVAYKAAPDTPDKFLLNHEGRIWRAVSEISGSEGISGPYNDKGIILEPGPNSLSWEGLQGTDSFFPWKVGNSWYAFYGSAKTETKPVGYWWVGMASAPSLDGPWKRIADKSPVAIEKVFIENPIVTSAPGNGWLVVYDNDGKGTFGWAYSNDGINWPRGNSLLIDSTQNYWCNIVRTPLGLVDEGNGNFTMFYSGFTSSAYEKPISGSDESTSAIGYVELQFK